MATQGLVTVLKGGRVVMKIITGSDGMHAPKLASKLRSFGRVPALDEAYRFALSLGFGSSASLVVMNERSTFFFGDDELSPLYRETFDQPEFNPRWRQGTADHVEVVTL